MLNTGTGTTGLYSLHDLPVRTAMCDMEAKIEEVMMGKFHKLADLLEERVSRKYQIRFRQLEEIVKRISVRMSQLEQKFSPRQNDVTGGPTYTTQKVISCNPHHIPIL